MDLNVLSLNYLASPVSKDRGGLILLENVPGDQAEGLEPSMRAADQQP